MKSGIHLLFVIAHLATPGRFLFRREKKDVQARNAALDEIFETIRNFIATSATLKPEWVEGWEERSDIELPPKYQPAQYIYPNAVDAAYDAKYARGLLYQNRWNSQINPLFTTYDPDTWAQVRALIERSSNTFLVLRERHIALLRAEEASWLIRAVEGIDDASLQIRTGEKRETPVHEVVASSTFQALYSVLQLSETMLDGLRREAQEK